MALVIIVGQFIFLMAGWVFFGITRSQPVSLPDSLAARARRYPQSVTFTVTLVSTFISIITAFLYSRAIRYALAMSLSRPVSLFTIVSSIRVAGKSPINNFIRPKWTIAAAICAAALSTQTAGWATLLTPRIIRTPTGLTGFGIDMTNPDFTNLVVNSFGDRLDTDAYPNIMPLIPASGVAYVNARLGLPSILNFNQLSFINSTGGVLPANLFQLDSAISAGRVLPANTFLDAPASSSEGFGTNYTVTQQGFTADVACEQRNLSATTVPAVKFSSINSTFLNFTVAIQQMVTDCGILGSDGSVVLGFPQASGEVNGIHADFCLNSTTGLDMIVVGSGSYSFLNTMVCNIKPKATMVDVNYNDASTLFNTSSWPNFIDVSEPRNSTSAFEIGLVPLGVLLRAIEFGQNLRGNTIGDSLSTFVVTYAGHGENIINDIMGAYILGALEFGGTLLRASYSETQNGLFASGTSDIPQSIRIPTNGTYYTETMGWYQRTNATPGVLLAPTFVTAVSIAIVLATLYRTARDTGVEHQDYFDVGNILHVMAASSAGGLQMSFPPFSTKTRDFLRYGQMVRVHLGYAPATERVGFIEHQSMSSE
ncbi:hypothetical protein BDN72DRAFT_185212 [Pluteus cervinus]|uniref:Uncharacterized protein n=1 Tax=Pluteus cervinus TaxID=181527 RepID=A0ACD3B7E4_9AGAR|nr:hypothetical protein BDN72DRAFT_185212 [Pluteus cervinus]